MPSRRENKRRMQARQREAEQQHAAVVIQDHWRVSRSIGTFNDAGLVHEHVANWQSGRRGALRLLPEAPTPRASCLKPTPARVRRVFWGTDKTFRGPVEVQAQADKSKMIDGAVQCRICFDLVQAPMFASCCPSAPSCGSVCFGCVYYFYELHLPPLERASVHKGTWSVSCSKRNRCRRSLTVTLQDNQHKAFPFFDIMRDEIGSSKCFACNSELATTAALRRHLDVCPNICAPCPQEGCSFYGTRAECTAHFRDVHERLTCPCCHESVLLAEWKNHAHKHMADLNIAVETDSRRWRVFSCGTVVRNS